MLEFSVDNDVDDDVDDELLFGWRRVANDSISTIYAARF